MRKNPKLYGARHNVFGNQPGLGITIFVRKSKTRQGDVKVRNSITPVACPVF